MGDVERGWKVGELARATGLTIRALHHYDEIGLLVPPRTEAGHRAYTPQDVERLYRVLALRGVGMPLQDIAAALDDDGASLVDTVRRHVAAVERDIKQRRRLLDRLLPPPGTKTFLTPHAAITVQRARSAALRQGTDEVDPARLLLALIDNSGAAAILGSDVDVVALRGEITALLDP